MKPKGLPLSGAEQRFEHANWTKFKMANNCYAYAFHDMRAWRPHKSVMGKKQGGMNHSFTNCKGIAKQIVKDNPRKVYEEKPGKACKKGHYKVMMVVAPTDRKGNPGGDFHFYKQHGVIKYKLRKGDTVKNLASFFDVSTYKIRKAMGPKPKMGNHIVFKCNIFSHKMGWATGPLLVDSCGKVIKDPRKACRKYGLNYSKYCNSFCVASNKGVKVGPI
jgi:hypothetical protein|tara:strand:+ start:944 stop:1597 length:654 start_codon:yes stop_codon:yes gene_type:complete